MLVLLLLVRSAAACQWAYGCGSLDLPDGMTAEFAPGDAIPLDWTVGCRVDSAELVDASGAGVPVEVVQGPDESLIAFPVPGGTPPGEYTLVVSSQFYYESRLAVTVVAPREPGSALLGAIELDDVLIWPAFETNFYCSGIAGWWGTATIHVEGAPGPGWLVRVAATTPDRSSLWLAVPPGGPSMVTGVIITPGVPASREGCVEIRLYDPGFQLVATSAPVCGALPDDTGEPDPGETDDPGDVGADDPSQPAPASDGKGCEGRGCASAPGPVWLAWLALMLARRGGAGARGPAPQDRRRGGPHQPRQSQEFA